PQLLERCARRQAPTPERLLLPRAWQAHITEVGGDSSLLRDLSRALEGPQATAGFAVALGAVTALSHAQAEAAAQASAGAFHRALKIQPDHVVAALNLIEALAALGQTQLVCDGAQRLLRRLLRPVAAEDLEGPLYPPGYSLFRVEWERTA